MGQCVESILHTLPHVVLFFSHPHGILTASEQAVLFRTDKHYPPSTYHIFLT